MRVTGDGRDEEDRASERAAATSGGVPLRGLTESVYPTPLRSWPDGALLMASDKPRWTEPPPRNPLAPSVRALRSDVTLDRVLGLGGFDLDRIKRWSPTS